jgi:hypothetical protein
LDTSSAKRRPRANISSFWNRELLGRSRKPQARCSNQTVETIPYIAEKKVRTVRTADLSIPSHVLLALAFWALERTRTT